jgi:hypothetical protein
MRVISNWAVALSLLALPAFADTIAFTPPGTVASTTSGAVSLGMTFSISSSILVDDFDVYQTPGLTSTPTVGIYSSGGTLIQSSTVSLTSPVVGGYYDQSIAPFMLAPGTYTVVEFAPQGIWSYGLAPGTAAPVTYLSDAYAFGSSLTYPTSTAGAPPAFYGPSFSFTAASPEPASLILFGIGLAGLIGARQWKRKSQA